LQPGLFTRDFNLPLLEDVARRAANHAVAETAKAKKERRKAKKELASVQCGKRWQGSEESDGDEEEEEEEDKSDPNISWGALGHEDEQADVGQANLTPIPQHASAQTKEDAPSRSAREDASLRLAEQVCPAPTDPVRVTPVAQHASTQTEEDAPPRSVGEDVLPRSVEQVRPAPTDPTG